MVEGGRMKIDCDECTMQHTAMCEECVVGNLLHDLLGPIEVDTEQAAALDTLADAGLVPRLQLMPKASNE
jgi:hypothetical protein